MRHSFFIFFCLEVSLLKKDDMSRSAILRAFLGLPGSLPDQDAIFYRVYSQFHRFYNILLVLIILYECLMLVMLSFRPGGPFLHARRTAYCTLYLILIAVTLFFLLYSRHLTGKMPQMVGSYFRWTHFYVIFINIWAVALTFNDHLGGNGLSVYTCILLSTAFFSLMQPWKSILLYFGDFLLLNLLLPFFPSPGDLDQSFNIGMNSLFITLLALALSIYTYHNQIKHKADELLIERQYKEIQHANQLLSRENITDTLTELYNRRYLYQTVVERFQHSQETGDSIACLMIDLDHFKSYNDRYGHPKGDRLLRRIAQFFCQHEALQGADIIRYGGEEFAIFLYGSNATLATEKAQRIVSSLQEQQLPHWDNQGHYVTIRIGVCKEIPISANSTLERLIFRADSALYEAKHIGRNCVVTYQPPVDEKVGHQAAVKS